MATPAAHGPIAAFGRTRCGPSSWSPRTVRRWAVPRTSYPWRRTAGGCWRLAGKTDENWWTKCWFSGGTWSIMIHKWWNPFSGQQVSEFGTWRTKFMHLVIKQFAMEDDPMYAWWFTSYLSKMTETGGFSTAICDYHRGTSGFHYDL